MGAKVGGITIEIGGDATLLTNALKSINTDLSKTGAALKEVNKLLEVKPTGIEQLVDKNKLLNTQFNETNKKLELLNASYEEMSKQKGFDANSKEAIALRTEIEKTTREVNTLIGLNNEAYNKRNPDEYTQKINSLNQTLSTSNDRLKTVSELLKLDPKNADLVREKAELLTKNLGALQDKLQALKMKYAEMSQTPGFDENSKEAVALRDEIVRTNAELNKTSDELYNVGKKKDEVKKVTEAVKETEEKTKSLSERLKETGKSIEDVGKKLSIMSTAVAGVGTYAVKEFMGFEAEISKTAAAMGTTVDNIKDIEAEARHLGETTVFTAEESASAFTILAQAGYNATKQIEVAPNVLNLAAAGGLSMADSAKYLTGTLNGFAKQVTISVDETGELVTEFGEAKDVIKSGDKVFKDAGEATQYFSDLMAKGATLAKTNVGELGEAMSVTASVASGAFGQSAESVTVALLRLADQNVTASQAGTALNQVMARLYAPTDKAADALEALGFSAYDAAGNARDVNEVVDELNGLLSNMTAEQRAAAEKTIFGQRALKSFSQMTATSADKTHEFFEALSDVNGSAGKQAETMLDNLKGRMTLMTSALSEAGITLGEKLTPFIDKAISSVRSLALWFNGLDEQTVSTIATAGLLVAAIGPVTLVIGKVISALSVLMAHPVIATIAIATAGVVALVAAVNSFYDASNNSITAAMAETDAMKDYAEAMSNAATSTHDRIADAASVAKANTSEYKSYYKLLEQLDQYIDENGYVIAGNEKQVQYIQNELSDAFGIEIDLLGKQAGKYKEVRDEVEKVIKAEEARVVLNAYSAAYAKSLEEQQKSLEAVAEASEKSAEAHAKLDEAQSKMASNKDAYDALKKRADSLRYLYDMALRSGSDGTWYAEELAKIGVEMQHLEEEYNDLTLIVPEYEEQVRLADAAMQDASFAYAENTRLVEQYGALQRAVAEGDVAKMTDAIIGLRTNMYTAQTATKDTLLKQAEDYDTYYNRMIKAAKDGSIKLSNAQLEEMRTTRNLMWGEYNKASNEAYSAGVNNAANYSKGFTSKKKAIIDEAYGIGKNITEGLAKGIKDFGYLTQEAAETVTGGALRTMKNVGVIKSPSHVTQYFGKMLDLGLSKGLLDNAYLPENAAEDVMSGSLDSFNGNGILTAQRSGFGGSSNTTNNTNVGGMTFIINSQPGQNVQELARQVSIEVQRQINSQRAVFA